MACPRNLSLCLNVKLKCLCSVHRETFWPCPRMNGYRKEEINTSPPRCWPSQEIFSCTFYVTSSPPRASLVAQMVKRLSAVQETRVRSLGREDPLEKEMAAHSSTLAWKIPWTEEPGRLQTMGWQRVRHDWATSLSLSLSSPPTLLCL